MLATIGGIRPKIVPIAGREIIATKKAMRPASRATTTTLIFAAESAWAMPLPNPRPTPVTIAVSRCEALVSAILSAKHTPCNEAYCCLGSELYNATGGVTTRDKNVHMDFSCAAV